MTHEYLEQLKNLSRVENSDNIGQIATVLAIKEVTDILERVAKRQDVHDHKLDEVSKILHQVDKRITRVEDTEVKEKVALNTKKIETLDKEITTWKTRMYTIMAAGTVAWAVFGDTFQNWIGIIG